MGQVRSKRPFHLGVSEPGDEDLRITYDGENEGPLGVGFGINGASVVQRCNKTISLDGEQKAIQFDAGDFTSMCLDQKRLVVVAQSKTEIEYRLFPDTQIKVVLHLEDAGNEYFEAFLPSAEMTTYGKTAQNRAMGPNNQVRAWLAGEKIDLRGNRTTYGWCIAENGDGSAAEYALDLIQTLPAGRTEPTQSIALVYGVKDAENSRRGFSHGVATQQTLQLNEVQQFTRAKRWRDVLCLVTKSARRRNVRDWPRWSIAMRKEIVLRQLDSSMRKVNSGSTM